MDEANFTMRGSVNTRIVRKYTTKRTLPQLLCITDLMIIEHFSFGRSYTEKKRLIVIGNVMGTT